LAWVAGYIPANGRRSQH